MKNKKVAALIYRDKGHIGHIDHIGPFCSLNNIPLYLTSKNIYDVAKTQYKELDVRLRPLNETITNLLKNYEHLISTLPKQLIDPIFLFDEMMQKKKLITYFLPHGSSDKNNMKKLFQEENIFIYGDRMLELLPEEVYDKTIKTGNYRLTYYNKHKDFYDNLINENFPHMANKNNVLFAPSWESEEIQKWTEALIKHKPKEVNLYIKFHPNTSNTGIGQAIPEAYKDHENIYFINNFFPIYPLLSHMSYLFMDISSIGYDFLSFDKPIFFLTKRDEPLHKCGIHIDINNPYKDLGKDFYKEQRTTLYNRTFGKTEIKLNF